MYIQLSEQEYNSLIKRRNNQYVLDVSLEEFEFISNMRSETNSSIKIYEKYIENLQKFVSDTNSLIASYSSKFLEEANKLKLSLITLEEFRKIDDAILDSEDACLLEKVNTINYIKNKIAEMYPE